MVDKPLISEFALIEQLFAPLADNQQAAHLRDDVAIWQPLVGHDLVLSTDAMVAGVHFPDDAPADMVAARLVASNLSDLAAKGARPIGCLLTLGLALQWDMAFITGFAKTLGKKLAQSGMALWGGDTVFVPEGVGFMSMTVHGLVPQGSAVRRSGASAGEVVCVTGVIGDGFLGLQEVLAGTHGAARAAYAHPAPPIAFGPALLGHATASIDVSDGLLADLDHICVTSKVAIRLDADAIPLSSAGHNYLAQGGELTDLLTGGDDYQIAFCAHEASFPVLSAAAKAVNCQLTRIGHVENAKVENVKNHTGASVYGTNLVDAEERSMTIKKRGYQHFRK